MTSKRVLTSKHKLNQPLRQTDKDMGLKWCYEVKTTYVESLTMSFTYTQELLWLGSVYEQSLCLQ